MNLRKFARHRFSHSIVAIPRVDGVKPLEEPYILILSDPTNRLAENSSADQSPLDRNISETFSPSKYLQDRKGQKIDDETLKLYI